ncbi:MAG: hypothetical protein WBM46_01845 [Polyangiales bacterium]|jgi:hypothetical protein
MTMDTQVMYDLLLKPLRFNPELTESVILGLKWTLGAMFEDAFAIRDVIVSVREVVDNVATHADWNQSPGPSLFIRYRVQRGRPQISVSSVNAVKDVDEAERAARFIHEHLSNKSSPLLYRELTARLIDSSNIQSSGGIGLLQVASSPRCRLDVRLEGALFHVRVDVDVPELKAPARVLSGKTGS